jgi:hypothetical protein
MSSKARSIAREIRRRGDMTDLDDWRPDSLIEDVSSNLHLCPKCRAARLRLLAEAAMKAADELEAPQEKRMPSLDGRTL